MVSPLKYLGNYVINVNSESYLAIDNNDKIYNVIDLIQVIFSAVSGS